MQWSRRSYLDLMTFSDPSPRPMFVELFGPLVGLEEEWRQQGATPEEIDLTAFDFDYVNWVGCGGNTGPRVGPGTVIEDTPTHRIAHDGLGRTTKLLKQTATIALPMDFPVRTMDDWLKLRPMFQFDDQRIDWAQVDRAREAQLQGGLVVAFMPGAYDTLRELMGEEASALAIYDDPELVHDILNTLSDTTMRTLEPISERLVIDQLSVHEDFAGRSGPLVGPGHIAELFKPYYRRVWDMLRSRGAKIFQQDTDGNINPVLDALLDCGLTSIYPMEPAAGMDVVEVRKRYGRRLAMLGGIDKHVLRKDKPSIRAELEYKLQPLMREGGMVFGLDHRIPNGTPLDNYRYYVDTAREILNLPPRTGAKGGWRRMAF
jgi:hypothetical protein